MSIKEIKYSKIDNRKCWEYRHQQKNSKSNKKYAQKVLNKISSQQQRQTPPIPQKKRISKRQRNHFEREATQKELKALRKENRELKYLKLQEEKHKAQIDFFTSRSWRELRYRVLKTYGHKCMLCQTTKGVMHVDHIKPRSKFPELELTFENLQVLCEACNIGKSNKDETDFRK